MAAILDNNFKNRLLEISQKYFGAAQPEYSHFSYGPPHDAVFLCFCTFQNEVTSHQGRTKKEAEKFCSKEMIEKLDHKFFYTKSMALKKQNENYPIFSEIALYTHGLNDVYNFSALRLLGNTILRSYIAQYLFRKYSLFEEGIFTRITSEAMNRKNRDLLAQNLEFRHHLLEEGNARKLADLLDATIGILAFKDRKDLYEPLLQMVYQTFIDTTVKSIFEDKQFHKEHVSANTYIRTSIHNHKSNLFELAQKRGKIPPSYITTEETGEDHNPMFTVYCNFNNHKIRGQGPTIKSAEQEASKKMLIKLLAASTDSARIIGHNTHKEQKYSIYRYMVLNKSTKMELERDLGCEGISHTTYLNAALTHPSVDSQTNYQRLEFLGDALLREILLLHILKTYFYANALENLGEFMSKLVSAPIQAKIAIKLNLSSYIFKETKLTKAILSDVLEALIAAIYLDKKTNALTNICVVTWYENALRKIFVEDTSKSSDEDNSSIADIEDENPPETVLSLPEVNQTKFVKKHAQSSSSSRDHSQSFKETTLNIDDLQEFPSVNKHIQSSSSSRDHSQSFKETSSSQTSSISVATQSTYIQVAKRPNRYLMLQAPRTEKQLPSPNKETTTLNIDDSREFPSLASKK